MPEQEYTGLRNKSKKSGRTNMELDDFKKKYIQKNDFASARDQSINERMDNMIDLFKSLQKKQRGKVITIIIVDLTLAVIYIANMLSQKGTAGVGYFILGTGLLGAVLYLFLRYRSFSAAIYSLPMKEFLERAEHKVNYLNYIDYIILIPLLGFLGTGGGIVFTASLLRHTDNINLLIIIWILFFVSLCIFGFWAGKKNWEKEYGDIHRRILEMKNNYFSDEDSPEEI
jgi:hypothetical protein